MNRMAVLLYAVLLSSPAIAQEEDGMFSADMIEEESPAADTVPGSEFEVSERIEWGGDLDARLALTFDEGTEVGFDIDASLFFDARPRKEYRVYGRLGFSYPFSASVAGADGGETETGDIRVEELYTDLPRTGGWSVRFGLFNSGWGTGYFFSPADTLGGSTIDPEEPEGYRRASAALRIAYVPGTTGLSTYLVYEEPGRPEDLTFVQTVDVVLGRSELGLGATYRYEEPLITMFTLSLPTGDVDLFAEAAFVYGSNRVVLSETDDPLFSILGFETATAEDEWLIDATVGLSYFRARPAVRFAAQYLYSSGDYGTFTLSDRLLNALTSEDPAVLAALSLLDPAPGAGELTGFGRHALAASASWTDVAESGFGVSCFILADIGDASGYVSPAVEYRPSDEIGLFAEAEFRFGGDGGRYSREGTGWNLTCGAVFGAGPF